MKWARLLWLGAIGLVVYALLPPGTPRALVYGLVLLLTVAAILSAVNRCGRVFRLEEFVEASIVASGLGLVCWVFLVDFDGGGFAVGPTLIHVVVDALVISTVLGLIASRRLDGPRVIVPVVLLGVVATADFASYLAGRMYGSTFLGVAWLAVYLAVGAVAAVLVSGRPRSERLAVSEFGNATLLRLSLAISLTPAVMGIELARGVPATEWGWVIVVASSVVIVLVSVRMALSIKDVKNHADSLQRSANTDSVTGLLSRTHLEQSIDAMIAQAGDEAVTAMIVDIDRFAQVNETFGYRVGDSVLREIAQRLDASVSAGDVVGRLGGDQFVVVARNAGDEKSVVRLARRLQHAVSRTMFVHDINVALEATVGVALSSVAGHDSESLLQHAHVALTAAKAEHERVAVYSMSMDLDRHDQMRLLGELETALRERRLRVFYQPCLHLASGRVTGLEALLRWQHPRDGLITPATFLPDAERTGLLPAITAFVVDEALGQCARLRASGVDISVSVNLSVRNLLDPGLVDTVASALAKHDVPANAIEFEVTETSAMTDPRRSVEALSALRGLGASIAIDDYGTGYSSLAYLRTLPVQRLKIDRSFVTTMNAQLTNSSIVQSTTELARSLGMSLVAEGVEDEATLNSLRDLGCECAQGFHIGRPVSEDEVAEQISKIETRYLRAAVDSRAVTPGR